MSDRTKIRKAKATKKGHTMTRDELLKASETGDVFIKVLEDSQYMARIARVLDEAGLVGKNTPIAGPFDLPIFAGVRGDDILVIDEVIPEILRFTLSENLAKKDHFIAFLIDSSLDFYTFMQKDLAAEDRDEAEYLDAYMDAVLEVKLKLANIELFE